MIVLTLDVCLSQVLSDSVMVKCELPELSGSRFHSRSWAVSVVLGDHDEDDNEKFLIERNLISSPIWRRDEQGG